MGKNTFFLCIICIGVFVSCKKTYTCYCTTYTSTPIPFTSENDYSQSYSSYDYKASKRNKDKEGQNCVNAHTIGLTGTSGGGVTETKCHLP